MDTMPPVQLVASAASHNVYGRVYEPAATVLSMLTAPVVGLSVIPAGHVPDTSTVVWLASAGTVVPAAPVNVSFWRISGMAVDATPCVPV